MRTEVFSFLSAAILLLASCQTNKQEPLNDMIERSLDIATQQALLMAKELEGEEGRFPKSIAKDGSLETSDYNWWCCGFFPGELWYLYEDNPTPELLRFAELYTDRVEPVKNKTSTHDLGFMLYCSYGNGYRITGNPHYKDVLITGAHSLATRYNPTVCAIRSWDFNRENWQFPVIIDNMMNLEFLLWVSRETGDIQFSEIANSHAEKTMLHHFRPDYSSYHVVSYDTISGNPHKKQTHQGYADESAWARGQAWALYGYTMMYHETNYTPYLELARHIARFMMNHPHMPEDKIPYWDFDAPGIPNEPRDASAAAIMASALLDLSILEKNAFGEECRMYAENQLRSLSSPEYLAEPGTNRNFLLKHSTGSKPGNSEVDVPLTYADYYYVEALLRLKQLLK